jgi:hypothetical protein
MSCPAASQIVVIIDGSAAVALAREWIVRSIGSQKAGGPAAPSAVHCCSRRSGISRDFSGNDSLTITKRLDLEALRHLGKHSRHQYAGHGLTPVDGSATPQAPNVPEPSTSLLVILDGDADKTWTASLEIDPSRNIANYRVPDGRSGTLTS